MRKLFILSVVGVLAAFCLIGRVHAQSTNASVTGFITDPSKASIGGAKISLINENTGVHYENKSNNTGNYEVPNVPPGKYRMEVEKAGFKTVVKTGIILNVQDVAAINFEMTLGSASEIVTVQAGTTTMNTTDGTVATVVDRQFVENLPLNGRSFQTLLLLTPGIVPVASGGINSFGSFSVDGQRASSNNFTVDGVSANFAASPGGFNNSQTSGNIPALSVLGTTQTLVSVDALQEFRVQTSSYAAEYGPQPGGQIAISTRSGTNDFHGTAFEYLRNTVFDANDWYLNRAGTAAVPAVRPPERLNDFGGVLGGPVRIPHLYNGHDRTFFFFSYEGLRLQQPNSVLTNVPDLCLRGMGPATGPSSCAALAATGNTPAAAAIFPILNAFPLPPTGASLIDLGNGFADYQPGYSVPSTINTTAIRIDHTVNNKLSLFARYNYSPSSSIPRATQDLAVTTPQQLGTQTMTGGAIWSISPTISNDFRINYSTNNAAQQQVQTTFGGSVPVASNMVIPAVYNTSPSVQATIFFTAPAGIPGFTGSPNLFPFGDVISSQHQVTIVDHLSYTHGQHQFKFGGEFRRETPVVSPNVYIAFGFFDVGNSINTVNISSGSAQTATIQSGLAAFPIFDNYSLFAEDSWKITHRLTVDIGLRWDIIPAPGEANGNISAALTQITNLAATTIAPLGTKQWATTWHNFSPRLGFAYQLRQTPGWETVVRGGFGTFYDTGTDQSTQGQARFPYTGTRSLCSSIVPSGRTTPNCSATATVTNLMYPLQASLVAPAPVPASLTPPFPSGLPFIDPNLQLPITYEWNVAVQQALGKSQTLTATYLGAAGRNLLQTTTDSLSVTSIKNPNFTTLGLTTNHATSDYDALQLQFQRRLTRGLQALVSYTWQHSLDTDSAVGAGFFPARGNSAFDIRQTLGVAMTFDIPSPLHSGIGYAITGGWAMDSNFHAQTAPPIDLIATSITDPATGLQDAVRPDVISGIPLYVSSSATCQANNKTNGNLVGNVNGAICPGGMAVNNTPNDISLAQGMAAGCALNAGGTAVLTAKGPFCTPATGTMGNLGRNQIRAQGAWQLDDAITKQFKITEKVALQFRAEAFNLLNHPDFGTVTTSIASSTFGEPTQMYGKQLGGISPLFQFGGPRSLQFALKLKF